MATSEPILTLHTLPAVWGLPSLSPACAKLETWLRLAEIPYEVSTRLDMANAPKGKVPFIEYRGEMLGDSTLIIERLRRDLGVDPDAGLSKVHRAISIAFRRLLKEQVYWHMVDQRYGETNWPQHRPALAALLHPEMSAADANARTDQFRDEVLGQMHGHGIGRHTTAELLILAGADFGALADYLDSKPFFFGERPTTVDATIFGYLGNIIRPPYDHPVREIARSHRNLVALIERMSARFFPELA
ncbi:MAG: glutathione S-transferase family protein [Myxococcales bacterium]|nr:glutathione S-transferase family protein [Myxococcales bacterium]MCB9702970.1 glutathione S-transferase family protein [Myxococcales bacterium]